MSVKIQFVLGSSTETPAVFTIDCLTPELAVDQMRGAIKAMTEKEEEDDGGNEEMPPPPRGLKGPVLN